MARWFVDRLPQRGIPSVSLRRLLPEARFVGCADWEVSGCTDDHRRLDPGQVFVAIRDSAYDGHAHVREAIERGAAGVIVERPIPEAGRLQVVVEDTRAAHSRICQALAGDPSRQLMTLGVTGTFGKTITSLFVRAILEAAGLRCGLIGSLGWNDGLTTRPLGASHGLSCPPTAASTPGSKPRSWPGGAAGLASILSYMLDQKCASGVVEVAAEALASRCFEGVSFRGAVVTDVSAPFGLPPEVVLQKRRAKARLFRQVDPAGVVVVNADDPNAELLGGVNMDAQRVSFGIKQPTRVDVSARLDRIDASGSRFTLYGFNRPVPVELGLVGPRPVTCALAAAALAWSLNIDVDHVVAGLEGVPPIAGHLEAVDEGQDFDVRIDAARTAEALAEALASLRAVSAGRLHCVLSAEGNQNRSDRRSLAEAAESGADRIILTLGNPRDEPPDQILDDLLAGFRHPGKIRVEPDRRRAIEAALHDARTGDAVLIAGKGRNGCQIHADRITPFDDFETARRFLRNHIIKQGNRIQRSA